MIKFVWHSCNLLINKTVYNNLSHNEIKASLMESKVNVIASRDEGAPRILSESITSGKPILLSGSTRMASIDEFSKIALQKFHSCKPQPYDGGTGEEGSTYWM